MNRSGVPGTSLTGPAETFFTATTTTRDLSSTSLACESEMETPRDAADQLLKYLSGDLTALTSSLFAASEGSSCLRPFRLPESALVLSTSATTGGDGGGARAAALPVCAAGPTRLV